MVGLFDDSKEVCVVEVEWGERRYKIRLERDREMGEGVVWKVYFVGFISYFGYFGFFD